jgi:biopolymer transport protein ExbD
MTKLLLNKGSLGCILVVLLTMGCATTVISMDKGINIIPPADGGEREINKDNIIIIVIQKDGIITFEDKEKKVTEIKSLAEDAIRKNPKVIFWVEMNPRTEYADYIKILEELKKARATKISIVKI